MGNKNNKEFLFCEDLGEESGRGRKGEEPIFRIPQV